MKILAIGDLHFPFHHRRAVELTLAAISELKPDVVIQVGDVYDMFSYGKFHRSMNVLTPKQEISSARKAAEWLWSEVRKRAPKSKRIQLLGNHDDRPYKRILEKAPEFEHLMSTKDIFCFDGVETVLDSREELTIGGTLFIHGFLNKLGDHVRYFHKNVVAGHIHRGGTVFFPYNGKTLFELNCGYLADRHTKALQYTSTKRTTSWTLGFGWIDKYGPRFVPLGLKP